MLAASARSTAKATLPSSKSRPRLALVVSSERKGLPFPGDPVQVSGGTHGDDLPMRACPCHRGGLGF